MQPPPEQRCPGCNAPAVRVETTGPFERRWVNHRGELVETWVPHRCTALRPLMLPARLRMH